MKGIPQVPVLHMSSLGDLEIVWNTVSHNIWVDGYFNGNYMATRIKMFYFFSSTW